MQRPGQRTRIITALAMLAYLSFSVPTIAADYFPLDVWEEMLAWEQDKATTSVADAEAYSQPKTTSMVKATMISVSFPFDVQDELNNLGGIEYTALMNRKAYNINYGTAREDTTNPYWMPKEYRTP